MPAFQSVTNAARRRRIAGLKAHVLEVATDHMADNELELLKHGTISTIIAHWSRLIRADEPDTFRLDCLDHMVSLKLVDDCIGDLEKDVAQQISAARVDVVATKADWSTTNLAPLKCEHWNVDRFAAVDEAYMFVEEDEDGPRIQGWADAVEGSSLLDEAHLVSDGDDNDGEVENLHDYDNTGNLELEGWDVEDEDKKSVTDMKSDTDSSQHGGNEQRTWVFPPFHVQPYM